MKTSLGSYGILKKNPLCYAVYQIVVLMGSHSQWTNRVKGIASQKGLLLYADEGIALMRKRSYILLVWGSLFRILCSTLSCIMCVTKCFCLERRGRELAWGRKLNLGFPVCKSNALSIVPRSLKWCSFGHHSYKRAFGHISLQRM